MNITYKEVEGKMVFIDSAGNLVVITPRGFEYYKEYIRRASEPYMIKISETERIGFTLGSQRNINRALDIAKKKDLGKLIDEIAAIALLKIEYEKEVIG